jgi:hypothetical protein
MERTLSEEELELNMIGTRSSRTGRIITSI